MGYPHEIEVCTWGVTSQNIHIRYLGGGVRRGTKIFQENLDCQKTAFAKNTRKELQQQRVKFGGPSLSHGKVDAKLNPCGKNQ